jgi:hypothetical protein
MDARDKSRTTSAFAEKEPPPKRKPPPLGIPEHPTPVKEKSE